MSKKKIIILLAVLLGLFVLWRSYAWLNRKPVRPVDQGASITVREWDRRIEGQRKMNDE